MTRKCGVTRLASAFFLFGTRGKHAIYGFTYVLVFCAHLFLERLRKKNEWLKIHFFLYFFLGFCIV